MACLIYYQNLDYDQLPTSRKRARLMPSALQEQSSKLDQNSCINNNNNNYTCNIITKPALNPHALKPISPNNYTVPIRTPTKPAYNRRANGKGPNKRCSYESIDILDDNDTDQDATQLCSSPYFKTKTPTIQSNNSFTNSPQTPNTEPPSQDELITTLKKYFGFNSFRGNQKKAVEATCSGLDTLILMPTGGGKSICYQLPAVISRGLTVVVSPLKSLIADQVNRLRSLNIKTSALFGETTEDEASDIFYDLNSSDPKHKLLYVTPEKINCSAGLMSLFQSLHKRHLLSRFVIDEAHCVSMWGSDFRPDYRKLGKLRDQFRDVPIMALTATAPIKVREDIFNQLKMNQTTGKLFIQSFNRPNLKFEVRIKSKGCIDDISKLIGVNFKKQCGIIYCLSRKECEQIAEKLRDRGITSAPYHAGLSDAQRKRVFQAWSNGTFQVVCATIAFGMGIDKANVRFVIHYSVPKSIEGYYQEAGRAGRDGDFASCILYFSKADLYRMKSMLSKGFGRKAEDKERDKTLLDSIIAYVENRTECRRSILLHYLGEEFDRKNCISHIRTACDNCLAQKNVVREDY